MQIRHEQFNQIIDLLGHAANAAAAYSSVVLVNEDNPKLEESAQHALTQYCTYVAELYHPQESPPIYLEAFNKKGETYHRYGVTMHGQKGASSQIRYAIYIGDIIAQIKQDFSVVDNYDTDRVIPTNELAYTGIFKLVEYATYTIESDISNCSVYRSSSTDVARLNFDASHLDDTLRIHGATPTSDFSQRLIMQILSHPVTSITGVILFLGGITLIVFRFNVSRCLYGCHWSHRADWISR